VYNKLSKKLALPISCITIFFIAFFSFSSISEATYFQWKWKNISFQGDVVVRTNADQLNSTYNGSVYTDALALWEDSGANVMMMDSSFANSTVDLVSVSASTWNSNGWGNGSAWTQPVREDNTACGTYPTTDYTILCGSGTLVKYAAIYFNNGNVLSSSKRRAGVAHELGHAMSLAHTAVISEKATSIMTQSLGGGLEPSNYDVSQINERYPK